MLCSFKAYCRQSSTVQTLATTRKLKVPNLGMAIASLLFVGISAACTGAGGQSVAEYCADRSEALATEYGVSEHYNREDALSDCGAFETKAEADVYLDLLEDILTAAGGE